MSAFPLLDSLASSSCSCHSESSHPHPHLRNRAVPLSLSNLPVDYFEAVAPLVSVWKAHRGRLLGGRIFPIGETPDGTAWTGFASVGEDSRNGYLLIFRELNDRATWHTALPMFAERDYEIAHLAGEGTARLRNRRLEVEIPDAQTFLFVQVKLMS